MELSNWCNSGSCRIDSYMNGSYDRIVSFKTGSKVPRWRSFWRRLMKEKKKIFDCCSPSRVHLSYDPDEYSQNFDQDSMLSDPDIVSRSFSARFAVSSRIFEKGGLAGTKEFRCLKEEPRISG
ncbi:hypothetical protein K2173_024317 [Erythroxylum novogranatense]|uniref:Uncharacterized protein n=1 Tax=Erythroxylum novogranatense TaxID=1862640 RepID=A0AAV8SU75_9ROSI|nr:hypothetical protein K2173_024317 [Erythroxylum novogranatense]